MAGTMTDAEASALLPAAVALVSAVGERDAAAVERILGCAPAAALAVLCAALVLDARGAARSSDERRRKEVRATRCLQSDPELVDKLVGALRERDRTIHDMRVIHAREIEELNMRVWDLPGGVKPAGMSLERAEQIAASAAERKTA